MVVSIIGKHSYILPNIKDYDYSLSDGKYANLVYLFKSFQM